MEYDHLNYTPPANKWKPHYQRMANGFTVPSNNQPSPARDTTPTPPIPPLPKITVAPMPPPREEQPLNAPEPPKRDEAISDDENEVPTP